MKKILTFIVCLTMLFLSACGGKSAHIRPKFDSTASTEYPENGVTVENRNYRLEFDSVTAGVILTELNTGRKWSTSPQSDGTEELDELGMPLKKHSMVMSPVTIRYKGKGDKVDNETFAYDGATNGGRIICRRIENKIRVEYYFDEIKIMVPITYTLNDNYLTVSVNTSEIQESNNIVTAVSLAPFLCSAKNNSDNSYLFIPSGSGAISGVKENGALGSRYSAQVFGKDASLEYWYDSTNHRDIRLPVYGVKSGDNAILAIIEKGADSATVESVSGAKTYGYSAVYSTFALRGNTRHLSEVYANETADTYIYDDNMLDAEISVRIYPLTDENAGYSGMADTYRNYLVSECGLTRENTQSRLNLNFIGGTLVKKSFLGIPYKTVLSTTKISDVAGIIDDMGISANGLTVNLKGFGEDGIDIGKIAGGYKISKKCGTATDMRNLTDYCNKKGIDLFVDFDICRFSKNGKGFSAFSDSIYSVTGQRKAMYLSDKAVRDAVDGSRYYFLSPRHFSSAVDKLIDKTVNWKLNGISLSTLSSLSYSDYRNKENTRYHSKSNFSDEAVKAIKGIKNGGCKFMSSDANAYAAVNSDIIVNSPTGSDKDYSFTCDIPFYQMVFRGYVPMSCESINLSESPEKTILSAVESGCGLDYTVIASWNNRLIDSDYNYFYSSLYDGVKGSILSNYSLLSNYYEKISDSGIVSHEIISDGVRKTVFENGVTVFVNYNDFEETVAGEKLEALSFKVKEGDKQ